WQRAGSRSNESAKGARLADVAGLSVTRRERCALSRAKRDHPIRFEAKVFKLATNLLQAIMERNKPSSIRRRSMKTDDLETIARKLVAPGKGILAADESSGTIEKRLKSINVPSTEENRRMYRQILFTTKGAGDFISGVILFDETIRQKNQDGRAFVEVLEQQGIVPGIKVDKGAKAMANFPGEKITEGLDGLRERL